MNTYTFKELSDTLFSEGYIDDVFHEKGWLMPESLTNLAEKCENVFVDLNNYKVDFDFEMNKGKLIEIINQNIEAYKSVPKNKKRKEPKKPWDNL